MLARLCHVLCWTARWRDSCYAAAGVTIAILIALGVPWYLAVMWGVVIGTPFTALHMAVSDDKAKWPIVWAIVVFEVLLIGAAVEVST